MEVLALGFVVVFLAELGDKTQLVALSLATRHPAAPVLAGVALGQVASQALAVLAGGLLGEVVPDEVLQVVAGLTFLGFAVWTFYGDDEEDDDVPAVRGRSLVLSVATAMFVGELGDKTMLASATLATRGSPVLTWAGAAAGVVAAGALAVLVGRVLGGRIPRRATRLAATVLFVVFGVALLAGALV